MATCPYCGKEAGLFRKFHQECQDRYTEGRARMISMVADAITSGGNLAVLGKELEQKSAVTTAPVKEALVLGWERAVDRFLDDDVLSEDEEEALDSAMTHFDLSAEELTANGSLIRVVQSGILRDLREGKIPERLEIQSGLPFNFQKSEKLVWLFADVKYYEQQTTRHYVGGSQGVSFRIAKGVYYRTSAFKGHPVTETQTVCVDTGVLGVTTKHLYFTGQSKGFRIRYDRIVTFTPYSDGIGVQRDAATAKPQTFLTGDGWFVYNLVNTLAQM
jgi:hypothetical protein